MNGFFNKHIVAILVLISASCFADVAITPEALAGWEKFKSAVLEGSKESVAEHAKFPIPSNDLGGAIKSEKQLGQRFEKIFEPWVKDCFKTAQPERTEDNDGFVVNCNGYLFGFKNINGAYKFSYIDNVNE